MDISFFRDSGQNSDFLVTIEGTSFKLHKFPLSLKCGYFKASNSNEVQFDYFPGGQNGFSLVADFCYGKSVVFSLANIVILRCAAELLQMHGTDNLESLTEEYIDNMLDSAYKSGTISHVLEMLDRCIEIGPIAEKVKATEKCFLTVLEMYPTPCQPSELMCDAVTGIDLIIDKIERLSLKEFVSFTKICSGRKHLWIPLTHMIYDYLYRVFKKFQLEQDINNGKEDTQKNNDTSKHRKENLSPDNGKQKNNDLKGKSKHSVKDKNFNKKQSSNQKVKSPNSFEEISISLQIKKTYENSPMKNNIKSNDMDIKEPQLKKISSQKENEKNQLVIDESKDVKNDNLFTKENKEKENIKNNPTTTAENYNTTIKQEQLEDANNFKVYKEFPEDTEQNVLRDSVDTNAKRKDENGDFIQLQNKLETPKLSTGIISPILRNSTEDRMSNSILLNPNDDFVFKNTLKQTISKTLRGSKEMSYKLETAEKIEQNITMKNNEDIKLKSPIHTPVVTEPLLSPRSQTNSLERQTSLKIISPKSENMTRKPTKSKKIVSAKSLKQSLSPREMSNQLTPILDITDDERDANSMENSLEKNDYQGKMKETNKFKNVKSPFKSGPFKVKSISAELKMSSSLSLKEVAADLEVPNSDDQTNCSTPTYDYFEESFVSLNTLIKKDEVAKKSNSNQVETLNRAPDKLFSPESENMIFNKKANTITDLSRSKIEKSDIINQSNITGNNFTVDQDSVYNFNSRGITQKSFQLTELEQSLTSLQTILTSDRYPLLMPCLGELTRPKTPTSVNYAEQNMEAQRIETPLRSTSEIHHCVNRLKEHFEIQSYLQIINKTDVIQSTVNMFTTLVNAKKQIIDSNSDEVKKSLYKSSESPLCKQRSLFLTDCKAKFFPVASVRKSLLRKDLCSQVLETQILPISNGREISNSEALPFFNPTNISHINSKTSPIKNLENDPKTVSKLINIDLNRFTGNSNRRLHMGIEIAIKPSKNRENGKDENFETDTGHEKYLTKNDENIVSNVNNNLEKKFGTSDNLEPKKCFRKKQLSVKFFKTNSRDVVEQNDIIQNINTKTDKPLSKEYYDTNYSNSNNFIKSSTYLHSMRGGIFLKRIKSSRRHKEKKQVVKKKDISADTFALAVFNNDDVCDDTLHDFSQIKVFEIPVPLQRNQNNNNTEDQSGFAEESSESEESNKPPHSGEILDALFQALPDRKLLHHLVCGDWIKLALLVAQKFSCECWKLLLILAGELFYELELEELRRIPIDIMIQVIVQSLEQPNTNPHSFAQFFDTYLKDGVCHGVFSPSEFVKLINSVPVILRPHPDHIFVLIERLLSRDTSDQDKKDLMSTIDISRCTECILHRIINSSMLPIDEFFRLLKTRNTDQSVNGVANCMSHDFNPERMRRHEMDATNWKAQSDHCKCRCPAKNCQITEQVRNIPSVTESKNTFALNNCRDHLTIGDNFYSNLSPLKNSNDIHSIQNKNLYSSTPAFDKTNKESRLDNLQAYLYYLDQARSSQQYSYNKPLTPLKTIDHFGSLTIPKKFDDLPSSSFQNKFSFLRNSPNAATDTLRQVTVPPLYNDCQIYYKNLIDCKSKLNPSNRFKQNNQTYPTSLYNKQISAIVYECPKRSTKVTYAYDEPNNNYTLPFKSNSKIIEDNINMLKGSQFILENPINSKYDNRNWFSQSVYNSMRSDAIGRMLAGMKGYKC